jgi:hypothetical protein
MSRPYRSSFKFSSASALVTLGLLLISACGPSVQRPTGLAQEFDDAKDMFKRGKFDKSLDFSDDLVSGSSSNKFTDRACVLRAVIFTGMVHAYKNMADAYSKGAENTKNPHYEADFGRQRHDSLQLGGKSALGLGEAAQRLLQVGTLPKELPLEAAYPSSEGPAEVSDLVRISEGGWVEPEQQEVAAVEAVRKGVDDSLAEIVGGDRAKARSTLATGSAKVDGVDFSLYLGKSLLEGAGFFDRKHIHDTQRYQTLLALADKSAKAGLDLLKADPNKDKEEKLKKLQGQIKTALKSA